ncbi:hypothetical protein [Campylobacter ureolyticus]|uniref:hypothetical protein n=1 Tax=Campylobacter ureolyticus TaxID=827 RepID=UPI0022B4DAE1|nr:hypothetical protein [Campylobacter ureolyticus]MCZ6172695.1 hypothetical protein [Campylobacter ureolyticus]
MQNTITIQANQSFLNEAIKLLEKLAKEQNQKIDIKSNFDDDLPILSDDEIYKEVLKRSKEIHNGTAELLSIDEFKKDMSEFLKKL